MALSCESNVIVFYSRRLIAHRHNAADTFQACKAVECGQSLNSCANNFFLNLKSEKLDI